MYNISSFDERSVKKYEISFFAALLIFALWIIIPHLLLLLFGGIKHLVSGGENFTQSVLSILSLLEMPLVTAIVSLLVTVVIALIVSRLNSNALQFSWIGEINIPYLFGTVFAVGGLLILSFFINLLAIRFMRSPGFDLSLFQIRFYEPQALYFLEMMLIIPLVEALIFRVLIARGLEARYDTVFAIVVASMLSAMANAGSRVFLTSLIVSLFLTWLFLYTRSLLLSVASHITLWTIGPIVAKYLVPVAEPLLKGTEFLKPMVVIVLGLLIFSFGVAIIVFRKRRSARIF